MDKATKKEMIRKLWIPRFNTFAIAMLMVLCIFLPYATATEKYAQDFEPDAVGIEELNLTIEDLETVSMAKYARIYFSMRDQLNYRGEGLVLTLLVVLIGCFALAAALIVIFGYGMMEKMLLPAPKSDKKAACTVCAGGFFCPVWGLTDHVGGEGKHTLHRTSQQGVI